MADATKLKNLQRSGLGVPPARAEARADLGEESPTPAPPSPAPDSRDLRIDGRTLRRSGRTVQFATRVSPEFDRRVREIAKDQGLLIVEVLERALDALEREKWRGSG